MDFFKLGAQERVKPELGVHYIIVKDGNGVEHKVINLDNKDICPTEGYVEIEAIKKQWTSNRANLRHNNNSSWKVIRDKEWDVLIGIPVGIDAKTKSIIWQKLTFDDGEILDLSVPANAKKWACFRRGPNFIDSPNYNSGTKSPYMAVNKEQEAKKFEIKVRSKRRAVDIAEKLAGEELREMGIACGFDVKAMSPNTLWMEVYKLADTKPDEFLKIVESDTRIEMTILKRAVQMNIVQQNYEQGYNWNGLTLGYSEQEAITYLRDNPRAAASIDALARETSLGSDKAMGGRAPIPTSAADARTAILEKQLAEMQELVKKLSGEKIEAQASKVLSNVDPEFEELQTKAKSYGIKGLHLIKDKEKLRKKVQEAEAKANN